MSNNVQVNRFDVVGFARTDHGAESLVGIVIGFGGGSPIVARATDYPEGWLGQRHEVYGRVPVERIRRIVKSAPVLA